MKDYLLKDYDNSLRALEADMLKDLNKDFTDLEITSSKYTDCEILEITEFTDFNDKRDVVVEVSCNAGIKNFCFNTCVENGLLILPKEKKELLDKYFEIYKVAETEYQVIEAEELRLAEIEAEKERVIREQRRKEKEAEIKREKRIASINKRKESIIKATTQLSKNTSHTVNNDYYVSVGYIAKHAKKIFAQLPDFIEDWFTAEFPDVDKDYMKVSDSNKLCPSGLMSTFALALQIDLDTNDNIPAYLTQYLGKTKRDIQPISNTQFIFDVMKNEGFVFGKKQDLDKVLKEIPTQFLDDFKLGYSL